MKNKLQKTAPAWHAHIAAELNREYSLVSDLSESLRHRRLRFGFMFIFVKEAGKADGSIPHGQFVQWLANNCPAIPRSTAGDYITEANSVCDLLRWEKSEIRIFEPHRLLMAPEESLNSADKERRKKLLKIIDDSEHFRAVTQYKQVELKDDATVGKAGRRKGEGGASKEQRARAQMLEGEARIEALKLHAEEFSDWLMEVADKKGLGMIMGTPELARLDKAMETARGFIRHSTP